MPWDIVVLLLSAAVAGRIFRAVAGTVAERTGHSRAAVDDALATGGMSLLLRPAHRGGRARDDEQRLPA